MGVLPRSIALQHALARTQGITVHHSCGNDGDSPAGSQDRRVSGIFTPAICECCLALVISAVADQTLLLTSGVLMDALSTHALVKDGNLLAISVILPAAWPAGWCWVGSTAPGPGCSQTDV